MTAQLYLAVGSVNRATNFYDEAGGEGLTILHLDENSLESHTLAASNAIDNPCLLCIDPLSNVIYALEGVEQWHESTLSAFHFCPQETRLTYLNKQPTLGAVAAHLTLTRDRRYVLVANYGADEAQGADKSLVAFPVLPDGQLGRSCAAKSLSGGSAIVEQRQQRSHAHMAFEDKIQAGKIWLSDLGSDRLIEYQLTPEGHLIEGESVSLHKGAGPRHLTQSNDGRFLYVLNELDSTLSTLKHDRDNGWVIIQNLSTILPHMAQNGHFFAAELALSSDGNFLYVSNRDISNQGGDTISWFAVDGKKGLLEMRGSIASGGKIPRHFALTPTGKHLLVAHQKSGDIVIFHRNATNGDLTPTGNSIPIANALCVQPFILWKW